MSQLGPKDDSSASHTHTHGGVFVCVCVCVCVMMMIVCVACCSLLLSQFVGLVLRIAQKKVKNFKKENTQSIFAFRKY